MAATGATAAIDYFLTAAEVGGTLLRAPTGRPTSCFKGRPQTEDAFRELLARPVVGSRELGKV